MAAQEEPLTPDEFRILFQEKEPPKVHKLIRLALEYEFGLKEELVPDVLSCEAVEELKPFETQGRLKLNDKLLELVCENDDNDAHIAFGDRLLHTFQGHLQRFIQRKGEIGTMERVRPVYEEELKKFKRLRRFIAETGSDNVDELLTLMNQTSLERMCISSDHYTHIRSFRDLKSKPERMNILLDIMERRSFNHFEGFFNHLSTVCPTFRNLNRDETPVAVQCCASKADEETILAKLNSENYYLKFQEMLDRYQKEVEKYRERKKAEGESGNKETQEVIVSQRVGEGNQSTSTQGKIGKENESENQYEKDLSEPPEEVKLLAARPGSVKVYLSCKDIASLDWIRKSVLAGFMKYSLQKSFNDLLRDVGGVTLNHVFLVDYSNQRFLCEYANAKDEAAKQALLRNGKENMKIVFKRPTYAKAREQILSRAFLFRALHGTKKSSKPKALAANHLSTVCKDWWKTLEQHTVKSILKRSLHKLLNKPELETKLKSGVIWNVGEKIICITTLLDDLYMVTESKRNVIQRCNLNSLEKLPEQQHTSGTSHHLHMQVAVRMRPEMISMPENVKISYIEASDKENGIFFIEEGNGNVWFWSRGEGFSQPRPSGVAAAGEQQRQASVMKQFSPSKCMTVCATGPVGGGQSTDEMRILLLPKDNILEIHPQHSKIIETILLPPTVHNPTCVIRNSKGYIFVGHGDDKRSRICMINNNGAIVLTYGDKPEHHPEKLNEPCSMTLGEDDCMYVADRGNNRILLLNSKMHLIKVLLDEKYDGITNPMAVRYVQNLNRLVVSCDNSIHMYGQGKFDFAASPHAEDPKVTATSEKEKGK